MGKSLKPEACGSGMSSPRSGPSFLQSAPLSQTSPLGMEGHSQDTAWPNAPSQSEQQEGKDHLWSPCCVLGTLHCVLGTLHS